MLDELKKIEFYLQEVKLHWNENPDFVSGFQFYSAWEMVQKPLPFYVPQKNIEISGNVFELTEENIDKVGCFCWDESEECPSLLIEGKEWSEKIILSLEDGEPVFIKQDPIFLEPMGLSYGERLEIIYDVIAHLQETKPGVDILNLKKVDFLSSLKALEENYDSMAISVMRKLSKQSVARFIRKASEDMTHDDLSSQLHLPLDGTYASRSLSSENSNSNIEKEDRQVTDIAISVSNRTQWSVLRDLLVQQEALKLSYEEEKNFILSFNDAEIVERGEDYEVVFKLKVDKDNPIEEGDILKAYFRGDNESIGSFRVDIFDTDVVYGRMRFFDSSDSRGPFNRLFALPRRSPLKFLFEALEDTVSSVEKMKVGELFRKITGLEDSFFYDKLMSDIPEEMDFTQKIAWSCAVNAENPVTLVQGPPGTGKTKVLVDVVRALCKSGKRILVTAPSNTAVDNICRNLTDLPLLRFGRQKNSIAPEVAASNWIGDDRAVMRFSDKRKEIGGGIYAGTHIGLLWDDIVSDDMVKNGLYDAIIFDEAGMASINEFILLLNLSQRAVLFGDHKQLPPFPLTESVKKRLEEEKGPFLPGTMSLIGGSALEWLAEFRGFPVILLKRSYRCQNPRLLRFSSILFYDALVSPSKDAEYFKLPYADRVKKYPPSTLKMISTSSLPSYIKHESLVFEGMKPGIENDAEAVICINEIYNLMGKFSPEEITLIAPYKRQIRLVKELLSLEIASRYSKYKLNEKIWTRFIENRISTVDSFQGGESDAVIICYVRSNDDGNIGFVDDANRINVAHTRCRKEMVVVGDIECLKKESEGDIFKRLERTVRRDGVILKLDNNSFGEICKNLELNDVIKFNKTEKKYGEEKKQKSEVFETEGISVEVEMEITQDRKEIKKSTEKKNSETGDPLKNIDENNLHQPDLF